MVAHRFVRLAAAALTAAGLISTAAAAAPGSGGRIATVSAEVDMSDLDMRRPGDAALLYARIVETARELCAEPWPGHRASFYAERRCMRGAVRDAVRAAEMPELKEAHRTWRGSARRALAFAAEAGRSEAA